MILITLYARKIPTSDPVAIKYCPGEGLQDTALYSDPLCTVRKATMRHDMRLDRRNRYVTLNCWRWRLQWVATA